MGSLGKIVSAIHAAIRNDKAGSRHFALHEPDIGGAEEAAVMKCLKSGWISSASGMVDEFERQLADYCGVNHVVACMNGTAALHLALYTAGVRAGDEVIVPAISFIATANAVVYAGAVPHFVDIDEDNLGIAATRLEAYLQEIADRRFGVLYNKHTGRRIAAIAVLHCLGYPCQIDALLEIAKIYNLPLIEDAAEALGSTLYGRSLGAFGTAGTLSFNGNKIITTGGGGAIMTNDADIAAEVRHLTTTAKVAHPWRYQHDRLGYNYRLPSINAALGIGQLSRIDAFLQSKRILHDRYVEAFSDIPEVTVMQGCSDSRPNHWLNAITLSETLACKRDDIIELARMEGLMVRPLWDLLPAQPHLSVGPAMDCSVAKSMIARVICLPSSSFIANGDDGN